MKAGLLIDTSTPFTVVSPVATSQVSLPAKSGGLPLCQFQLSAGQIFSVTYVVLHFIGFKTLGFLGKVNTGLPLVYVGCYYQSTLTKPSASSKPVWQVGLEMPGVIGGRQQSAQFKAPGIYQFLLVNNAASSSIEAVVTGNAQIFNVVTGNAQIFNV
jgi:hypothetical protein